MFGHEPVSYTHLDVYKRQPFDRSIDVQVSRLRRRLRDDSREAAIVKTVRNEGYLLAAHVSREF